MGDDLTNQHEAALATQVEPQFDSLDPALTQAPGDLSSVDFDMLPFFTDEPPPCASPNNESASRGSSIRGPYIASRVSVDTDAMGLDQGHRTVSRTSDRQATGRVIGRELASLHHQSKSNERGSPRRAPTRATRPTGERLFSWVHRLSELNVELHQHMLSIPQAELQDGKRTYDNLQAIQNTEATSRARRLHIDRTLELSYKFIDILTKAVSPPKSHRSDSLCTPNIRLNSSSTLLVLSGFMCLADTYDRSLQQIKQSIRLRSKSASAASTCCVLPEVAIGIHRLPVSSPARTIILACLIETAVMQAHGAVCRLITPSNDDDRSRRACIPSPNESSAGRDSSDLAMILIQAVTTREEATVDLAQDVWKLATRL